MSVALVQFKGTVKVGEQAGESTSLDLDFSRGCARLAEIRMDLKANTAVHTVDLTNVAPFRVLAVDCAQPLSLTLGGHGTTTFIVRSNLVMTCNYSTLTFKNQTSVVNAIRLMVAGGAGPA